MFCSTVLSLFSFASSCLSSCLHSFPTRRSSDLEVVRVLAELVVRQANDEPLDRAGREDQQEKAADQLEEAVQPQIGRAHVLNSSHITISYAVFCLKKKNKRTRYVSTLTLHSRQQ